jgi:WD40 repeat protein
MTRSHGAVFLIACLAGAPAGVAWASQAEGARPAEKARPAGRADSSGDPLPDGAIARLGTLRWRQALRDGSGAARLSFSRDGKFLASAGSVGLAVWEVRTGKPAGWAPPARGAAAALFSPDGKALVTESAGPLGERLKDPLAVRRLIQHWEVGTGKLLREVPLVRSLYALTSTVLSPDGTLLVSNTPEGRVCAWDARTGRLLRQIPLELSYIDALALSGDGKVLAAVAQDGTLWLYETATGKALRRFESKVPGIVPGAHWPALSPDGRTLVAFTPRGASVWDAATGRLRKDVKDCHGRAVFSPDNKLLAIGDRKAVRLLDARSLAEIRRFEAHHEFIRALAFSPDGRLLATAHEHTIGLWDVATGKRLNPSPGHHGVVLKLAFSPDGKRLASGGDDGLAMIWDLPSGKAAHRLAGRWPEVVSLAWSPDGGTLATGDGHWRGRGGANEAMVRLFDAGKGRLLRQFFAHLHGVESLAFSPAGPGGGRGSHVLASGGGDARVRAWDPASGKRLWQARGAEGWKYVGFSPDGKALLAGGSSGDLHLYQPNDGRELRDLTTGLDESRQVLHTAFLPDGKTFLTAERNTRSVSAQTPLTLSFRDAVTGRVQRSFSVPAGPGYDSYPGYALARDGKTVAVVVGDYRANAVELWDTASGKRVARLDGHAGAVIAVAFSPDGKTLATGSRDTTVLLWDVTRGRVEHLFREVGAGGGPGLRALREDPGRAVPVLKERLAEVAAAEGRAARLLVKLDSDTFRVREEATRELERLAPRVEPALRLAVEHHPSAEVRRRAQKILGGLKRGPTDPPPLDPRRVGAAVALLEELGTAAARQALEELARGPAASAVTREAQAALRRLGKGKVAP